MRKDMKEQGSGPSNEQFLGKREGVFGGLKRVADGMILNDMQLRGARTDAREVVRKKRE